MFKNCSIVFHESPQGVYFSGQTVNGTINIMLDTPKKILDMTFNAVGESRVRWSETQGTQKNRRTVVYHAHEVYFTTPLISLTGAYPREDGNVIINAGLSSFNFSIALPPSVPSSFQGIYGKCLYYLKITITKGWSSFDKKVIFPFTVICMNDLNFDPMNSLPIKQDLLKNYSFLFAKKGSLRMVIEIPQTGFVPGQQIPISCTVENSSKIRAVNITYCLERMVTYTCTPYKFRKERHKLVEYIGEGISKNESKQHFVALAIPAAPPSSPFHSIIFFEYFVKVRAIVTGMHSNLKCHIPVKIGNVPLRSASFGSNQSSSNQLQYQDAPPQYQPMGLPTYEESEISAKMLETDPEDVNIEVPFSPRYPVFHSDQNHQ